MMVCDLYLVLVVVWSLVLVCVVTNSCQSFCLRMLVPSHMSSYALLCGQTVMRGSDEAVSRMGLVGGAENGLKRHSDVVGTVGWCRQIPRKQVFLGSAWSVSEQDDAGSMVCLLGEVGVEDRVMMFP